MGARGELGTHGDARAFQGFVSGVRLRVSSGGPDPGRRDRPDGCAGGTSDGRELDDDPGDFKGGGLSGEGAEHHGCGGQYGGDTTGSSHGGFPFGCARPNSSEYGLDQDIRWLPGPPYGDAGCAGSSLMGGKGPAWRA
ncbi:hypothetical protein SSP24_54370 [Streptomyces spinoverrucosus]|uniref:Uncharacterized protein n=1 Tax=Streptomyces spinoverrucosus TaxID=284043 RepID=A0A4Y3VL87_9ACTN|nr:hypothetical protein SSP24_54370 [Streptomyces spinoverrucosus]